MSATSDITLGTIGQNAGIPNLNVSTVPENVRDGGSKAMQAYSQGLAFEDMLVNELSQQMSKTMFDGTGDGSSSDSGDPSSSGAGGSSSSSMLGGASAYSSMIPQALTSSIMDDGGLGMAQNFAEELDPSLLSQATAAAGSSTAAGASTTDSADAPATSPTLGSARQVML
jgi:hypothetical protein